MYIYIYAYVYMYICKYVDICICIYAKNSGFVWQVWVGVYRVA